MRFFVILLFVCLMGVANTGVVCAHGDSLDNAEDIVLGAWYQVVIKDGSAHYYKVRLYSGDYLIIDYGIHWDRDNRLLIPEFLDEDGNRLDVTQIETWERGDVSFVKWQTPSASTATTYYIVIHCTSGGGDGEYELKVERYGNGDSDDGDSGDGDRNTVPPFDCSSLPPVLRDFCEWLNDNIVSAVNALVEFQSWLSNVFADFWQSLANLVMMPINTVNSFFVSVQNAISGVAAAIGSFLGSIPKAIGSFFGEIGKSIQDSLNWINEQLSWSKEGLGGSLQADAVLIVAIILIVVGVAFFSPALWLGVLVLGIWALQQVATQGDIIQGLFGNERNLLMIILASAGLIILLRR